MRQLSHRESKQYKFVYFSSLCAKQYTVREVSGRGRGGRYSCCSGSLQCGSRCQEVLSAWLSNERLVAFPQIVRADLKELRDFSLDGAPYGYTPFCDSRKEMDGYRFWKSGYWASHLAGRKYHIRY